MFNFNFGEQIEKRKRDLYSFFVFHYLQTYPIITSKELLSKLSGSLIRLVKAIVFEDNTIYEFERIVFAGISDFNINVSSRIAKEACP